MHLPAHESPKIIPSWTPVLKTLFKKHNKKAFFFRVDEFSGCLQRFPCYVYVFNPKEENMENCLKTTEKQEQSERVLATAGRSVEHVT